MDFGSPDGGDYGKHSGVDFVGMSKISVMQDTFFFGTESFDITILNMVGCHHILQ